ncbi:MAG: hypothetical protein AB1941_23850 [Gemmatimonadota bacterium]
MRVAAAGALVLLLAGCAANPGPGAGIPAEGRYRYRGSYTPGEGAAPRSFAGTLVIERATRERIVGRWEVPGFRPVLQLGVSQDGAYVADADLGPAAGTLGTFQHRLRPGETPTRLRCAGRMAARVGDGLALYPATCSLEYLGRADAGT